MEQKFNIKLIIGIIIALIVIGGGYFVFSKQNSDKSLTEVKPIKIGIISGLTGEYASAGQNLVNGAELAKDLYIKNNPGKKVELIVEDDQFNAQKGLTAYKKLVEVDKVDAILNMTSPTINAFYDLARSKNIPVVIAGEQGRPAEDDNVFQVYPNSLPMYAGLAKYIKDSNLGNTAFFYLNDSTWLRFADEFRKNYGNGLGEYKIIAGQTDFRTIITKALAKKPNVMVYLGPPTEGALIVKETTQMTSQKLLFMFDPAFQAGINDYKKILGNLNILDNGKVVVLKQSSNIDFSKAYKEKFGVDVGFPADLFFDGFNLLVNNYSSDNKVWIENMKKANFEGAGGLIKFDDVGVRLPEFKIKTIQNGEIK